MLLVIGRSSCMCKYCPLIEDIEFPNGPGGYEADRLPKKVHIPWTNWKSRKNHVGEKYFITIGRNYTDSRFCSVFWLMYMLALKKKHGDPITGPLFPIRKLENFQKHLKTLFKASGLPKCCSHCSVRQMASQWTIRCGINTKNLLISDVGWILMKFKSMLDREGLHISRLWRTLLMARILLVTCGSFDQQSILLLVENSTMLSCYS